MKKKNEFFNKLMNFYITTILALISFYVLLLVVVFFFQGNLLYHPSVNNYLESHATKEPTEIEKIKITTKDRTNKNKAISTRLKAFFIIKS